MKTPEREGYLALQLGCGAKRPKQVHYRCSALAVNLPAVIHAPRPAVGHLQTYCCVERKLNVLYVS